MAPLNPLNEDNRRLFIIRDKVNCCLISLPLLMKRIPFIDAEYVSFKDMCMTSGKVFNLLVPEFERLSKLLSRGFIIGIEDFERFLSSDLQIIDGIIYFIGASGTLILKLECVDASQWEISTNNKEIEVLLEKL